MKSSSSNERMFVPVCSWRLILQSWMMLNEAILRVNADSAAALINC
jgi:hypothetical protein